MSPGPLFGRGRSNSVTLPSSVIRPILLALNSENQMLPSGPAASARGPLLGVGIGNSVMTPCGVTRPIFPPANSPNHTLPSRPSAVARGWLSGVGMSNSVMAPAGVMRPIRLPRCSENQKLPSDPAVMIRGELLGCGSANSMMPEPSGRHAADAVAGALGEPDGTVARNRNRRRPAAWIGQRKFRERAGRRRCAPSAGIDQRRQAPVSSSRTVRYGRT